MNIEHKQLESVVIAPFNPESHDSVKIAGIHLGIREWEVDMGYNTFSNITEAVAELSDIETSYTNCGGQFLVATESEKILGFVGIRKIEDGLGEVTRFAVIPEAQGRGIGTAILGSLVKWAHTKDFKMLQLSTGKYENAERIYHRHGFVTYGSDEDHQDWLMRLHLGSN